MSNRPRKKKTAKSTHPTSSFAQMVGNAQLNALKPYIDQQVQMQGYLVQQKVSKLFLEQLAGIHTRIIALEELLLEKTGVSKEELAVKLTEVEDQGLGFELVEGPAEKNDMVRIDFKEKAEGEEYPENWEKLRINSLCKEVDEKVQTLKELEFGLIGMSEGDEKEIYLEPDYENTPEGEEPKGAYVLAKIVRVSRRPVPQPQESTDGNDSTSK